MVTTIEIRGIFGQILLLKNETDSDAAIKQCGKTRNSLPLEKIFREINSLVTYLVKLLLSFSSVPWERIPISVISTLCCVHFTVTKELMSLEFRVFPRTVYFTHSVEIAASNLVSHIYGKSLMNLTYLLKKLLDKELIWRNIFYARVNFLYYIVYYSTYKCSVCENSGNFNGKFTFKPFWQKRYIVDMISRNILF